MNRLDSISQQKVDNVLQLLNTKLRSRTSRYQILQYILDRINRRDFTADMKARLRSTVMEEIENIKRQDNLSEENSKLKSAVFHVPEKIYNSLLSTWKEVFENPEYTDTDGYKRLNNIIDRKGAIGYDWMRSIKHYFDHYSGDGSDAEYIMNGGRDMGKWIEKTLGDAEKKIVNSKYILKNSGVNNAFLASHYRDNSKITSNPKAVTTPID